MASAQTEPSMDEILASIRRIISEEDDAPQELPVRQKLETLTLRDEAEDDDAGEAAKEEAKPKLRAKKADPEPPAPEEAEPEASASEPESEEGSDHVSEAAAQDVQDAGDESDDLDDFEPLPEEPVTASSTMEPAAAAHDGGDVVDDTFDAEPDTAASTEPEAPAMPSPQIAAVADAVRPAVAKAVSADLSVSERAAGQAASAFGALEENMRLSAGSGRTIEDLIEAMLAPMLQTWLDDNLPRIVEDKVEEEVRRISRRR